MNKHFNMAKKREAIHWRPGMFLWNTHSNQDIFSVSLFTEFIITILSNSDFTIPDQIVFQSFDEHHTVMAQGSKWNIESLIEKTVPATLNGSESLIEWAMSLDWSIKGKNSLSPLLGFSNIAAASQFCTVDITTEKNHFRQFYYEGIPCSPCERYTLDDWSEKVPYIRISFTPSPKLFQSCEIQLKQIVENVEKINNEEVLSICLVVKSKDVRNGGIEVVLQPT